MSSGITDDGGVDSHTFGDPEEALAEFTPERRRAARPRVVHLDEQGRRLPEPEGEQWETRRGVTPATGDASGAPQADPSP